MEAGQDSGSQAQRTAEQGGEKDGGWMVGAHVAGSTDASPGFTRWRCAAAKQTAMRREYSIWGRGLYFQIQILSDKHVTPVGGW